MAQLNRIVSVLGKNFFWYRMFISRRARRDFLLEIILLLKDFYHIPCFGSDDGDHDANYGFWYQYVICYVCSSLDFRIFLVVSVDLSAQ